MGTKAQITGNLLKIILRVSQHLLRSLQSLIHNIMMIEKSTTEMPLRSMKMAGGISNKKLEGIVALANGKVLSGIGKLLSK